MDASTPVDQSIEAAGTLAGLTRPKGGLAVVVCAGLLAGALVWSFVGEIFVQVAGLGVALPAGASLHPVVAQASGVVSAVLVRPGQRVEAGAPIATVDQTALRSQLAAAQQLQDRLFADRAARAAANASDLDQRRATVDLTLTMLRAREASMREQVAYRTRYLASLRSLVARGFATRNEVEQAVSDLAASEINLRDTLAQISSQRTQLAEAEQSARSALDSFDESILRAQEDLNGIAAKLSQSAAVVSPVAGHVVQVGMDVGAGVAPGQLVAMVQPQAGLLEALVFFRVGDGKRIAVGDRARLAFDSVDIDVWGTAGGTVSSVGALPETPQSIGAKVWNDFLVREVTQAGPPLAVSIALDVGPDGQPLFSAGKPPVPVTVGTTLRALVIVERDRPIAFVLPALRRLAGRR